MGRYTFIKGHYTATFNSIVIGTTQNGFLIRQRVHTDQILVDEGGQVPVDAINMGTEYAIEMRDFVEYSKVKAAMLASTGSAVALGAGMTQVGSLQTLLSFALVLTPQDTTNNVTYTAAAAIVEGDIDIPLHTGLKKGSCTFICYPLPTASTNATALAIVESGGMAGN